MSTADRIRDWFLVNPKPQGESMPYFRRCVKVLGKEGVVTTEKYVENVYFRLQRKLVKTKEVQVNGKVTKEVYSRRDERRVDPKGLVIDKVVDLGLGAQNVTYVRDKSGAIDFESAFKNIWKKLGKPKIYNIPKEKFKGDRCAVLNMYDAHLDKLSVARSNGRRSTLDENVEIYMKGFRKALGICKANNVEQIVLPVGNDLFHTNGMNAKTKKGTPIQYLCDPELAYETICLVVIKCVEMASQVSKVFIPFVRSNHDRDKIAGLSFWLRTLFKDNKNITFDDALQRTYFSYGVNLFCFAHGDQEKNKINEQPLLMHEERPVECSKALNKKIYLGDIHHGKEFKFLKSQDKMSTSVEFLRAVGQSDDYHNIGGWIGVPKSVYVDIWKKKEVELNRVMFCL